MAQRPRSARMDGPVGRFFQWLSSKPAFAKVAPSIITPLDKLVHRLTGGRRVLSQGLLPMLVLTTTGAKSGEPRTVPLACFPDGDVIFLVGSNFGRDAHPAWTANLRANPDPRVS